MARRKTARYSTSTYSKEAHRLACETFAQSSSDEVVPSWLVSNVKFRFRQDDEHIWIVVFYLHIKCGLPEGAFWEDLGDGRRNLVTIDAETGAKRVFISYEDHEPIYIAAFQIDLQLNQVKVEYMLDPEELKLLRFEVYNLYQSNPYEKSWGNAFDS